VSAIPLFPGDVALAAEVKLVREVASRPDGWVYMTNWYAAHDCPAPESTVATPSAGCAHAPVPWHSTLGDVLKDCAKAGGTIRALFWDGTQTVQTVDSVVDGITEPLLALTGLISSGAAALARPLVARWLRDYVSDKTTNLRVNRATRDFINNLHHSVPNANAMARLDDATLSFGSHHQKILVVGNSERTVGVIGGVDWNPNRKQHIDAGTPYFDVSVQIDGPAAADVADLFERRWRAAWDRSVVPPLPQRRSPSVAAAPGSATVQIGVNFACRKPLADIPHAIRNGGALIRNALLNCRRFFYAEDQYGIGNRELAEGITQAFANGARYGVVVLANSAAVDDIPDLPFRRYEFWSKFPQTGRNLLVFERLGDDGSGPNGPHAYVHSKLLLVDDQAATIGSMNMNRRSWYHDSEIAAVITDAPTLLRDLRLGIWRCHLPDVSAPSIADPLAAFPVWFVLHSTPFRTGGNVAPLWFAKRPSRHFDKYPVIGGALNDVVDQAHLRLFDPSAPTTCA
jgi:phosphatidylserine/phosphatidylglycerophosphate/cardiolipin synthase-like enzyme